MSCVVRITARTVKHARGDLAPHPLAERELAHRRREQALEIEQRDQFVEIAPVILRRHAIYVAQQHEAVGDREVPPKLRALSEHGADTRHVSNTLLPRDDSADLAAATRRLENAAEDLDCRGLPCSVRPDKTEEFSLTQREAHALERVHESRPPPQESRGTLAALGNAEFLRQVLDDDLRHGTAYSSRSNFPRTRNRVRPHFALLKWGLTLFRRLFGILGARNPHWPFIPRLVV